MFQCSFSILNMHIVSVSPTLTEWLWKSVTTISFLLFTATKCGPAISRGDKKGETRQERWVIFYFSLHDRKFHTIFGLDWKRTTRRRQRDSLTWESVWDKTEAEKECAEVKKKKKKEKTTSTCHTHGGNIYLLKAGPDLLSFCSSAMFVPLFSTRKEKFQVRDDIERKDEFQSWVRATNDARGSIPLGQAPFLSDGQRWEEIKNLFMHLSVTLELFRTCWSKYKSMFL